MTMKFPPREDGQGLVEYALILVLVAIVVIAVLLQLGPQIGQVFSRVTTVLQLGSKAGNQIVSINSFSVDGNMGFSECVVTLTNLEVSVTQTGEPVSGAPVQVTVTLQNGDSNTFSGTTNSSGTYQWTSGSIGSDTACGRTATATAGGASRTAVYN